MIKQLGKLFAETGDASCSTASAINEGAAEILPTGIESQLILRLLVEWLP